MQQEQWLSRVMFYLWLNTVEFLAGMWHAVVKTVWKFNGVEAKLQDIRAGKERHLVAQVLHNWYTLPYTLHLWPISFLTTHESFVPSSVVLKPNILLLSYGRHEVRLLELSEDADMFNLNKNPFMAMAQVLHTQKLIVMPTVEYDALLRDVGEYEHKVVWMFHMARSGSTLLAQMFHTLPDWTVISECQTMVYSTLHAQSATDMAAFSQTKFFEDLVVAYIKSYLRLVPKGNSVFWKSFAVLSEHMIPIIHAKFPTHKIMFSYRNSFAAAKSYHNFFSPQYISLNRLELLCADMDNLEPASLSRVLRLFWTTGYNFETCRRAAKESGIKPVVFEWFVLRWSAQVTTLTSFQGAGIPIKCVKYEDIISDPHRTVSKMFSHVGVALDLVDTALLAMKRDSQAGYSFSKDHRKNYKGWVETEEAIKRCNRVLQVFNLPNLRSDFAMEGTL